MIQKFQQGGANKLQEALIQFVQALAQTMQADPQQLILVAQQNPEALQSAVQVYQQTLDMTLAAQAFSQALQAKTQAARHGAKLNYIKSLKHQCAEDEELVYYKKGGRVDCGCKKKGGELKKEEKKESVIDRFKKMAKGGLTPPIKKKKSIDQATRDSLEINDKLNMELFSDRPGHLKPNPNYRKNGDDRAQLWVPDRSKAPYKKPEKKEKGGEVKKDCGGSKMKLIKKGGEVCPKCGKIHSGSCAVASFKNRKKK